MSDALELVAEHLASPASGWSIGTYGVLAEFARELGEPFDRRGLQVVTARGAIRIEANPAAAARAYEVLSVQPLLWHHGVLFCLPERESAMPARRAITELGPDRDAIRPDDRAAVLFDLGLGSPVFAFCVRTSDPALATTLRRVEGNALLAAGRELAGALVAASPHRVAFSRLARIEVYQPIAPEGGATPTGPHTHLLPRLLRPQQSHSANIRLPAGAVPGPHAVSAASGQGRGGRAQTVLGRRARRIPDRLRAVRRSRGARGEGRRGVGDRAGRPARATSPPRGSNARPRASRSGSFALPASPGRRWRPGSARSNRRRARAAA